MSDCADPQLACSLFSRVHAANAAVYRSAIDVRLGEPSRIRCAL